MPLPHLLDHLDEPHYLTSAWRRYDSAYLIFPILGTIFSVMHWRSEAERKAYLDQLIDAYTAIYEAQNLQFDTTKMGIGLGHRGDVFALAAFTAGGRCTQEELDILSKKAAEHHARAVFMKKIPAL